MYILHKHEKPQTIMIIMIYSCSDWEGRSVCVASGVKHLPWWVCVVAVHTGVKLQICAEIPMVQAQFIHCSDPKPQARGLRWQLLHHCGNEGGRGQVLVPSWLVEGQHHPCGSAQHADSAHCVRWAVRHQVPTIYTWKQRRALRLCSHWLLMQQHIYAVIFILVWRPNV